jgi:hypothetical protein
MMPPARTRYTPTVGDTMIGAAAVKETLDSIAGHPSRDTSSAAALIAFAVVALALRPAIEGTLRAVRQSFRGLIAAAHSVRAAMRVAGGSRGETRERRKGDLGAVRDDRAHRGAVASG